MNHPQGTQGPGRVWEARARKHLELCGLDIITQGYRCRLGELDLIASDGKGLIVVEVRARAQSAYGSAIETVGAHKQHRIIQATRHFLMRNPGWFRLPVRFDVIAFDGIDSSSPKMTWLKNAFDAH